MTLTFSNALLLSLSFNFKKLFVFDLQRQQSENKTRGEQIVLMQLAYDCNTSVAHNEKLDMYVDVWLSRIRHNVVEQVGIIQFF